jgi:hypothetical protein
MDEVWPNMMLQSPNFQKEHNLNVKLTDLFDVVGRIDPEPQRGIHSDVG